MLELEKDPQINPPIREAYQYILDTNPSILVPPCEVSQVQLVEYRAKHAEIYSTEADSWIDEMPQITVIRSGMFGGKTTLAFNLEDRLKAQGQKVTNLIAFVMGEDYVTGRSYSDDPNKNRRSALKFGDTQTTAQMMKALMNSDSDYFVLDEFSFLPDTQVIEDLIQACLRHDKGLILTGLDTNYLGHPLAPFQADGVLSKFPNIKRLYCKSFVPGICDDIPQGTNTIRYAYINGQWILDIGVYPTVVSKEHSEIVKYAPAMRYQTASHIFKTQPHLLDAILYPTELEDIQRRIFLKKSLAMYNG